jgi:hypothetical protein
VSETAETAESAVQAEATTTAEEAAQRALERAGRAPEALGGPPADDVVEPIAEAEEYRGGPIGPTGPLGPDGDPEPEPRTGAERYAQRLAREATEQRGDGEVVVADEYVDARDAVADGSGDEADFERVQEWLLSDEAEVNTRKLLVRLGGADSDPLIAPWFIRAIGIDTIRSAEREASAANRAARRAGAEQYDELKANLRIVVEGTVGIGKPPWEGGQDCKTLAQQKGLRDPTTWLQRKFQFRPGAIARIAGEIMGLSGFDQEDVRAAGN